MFGPYQLIQWRAVLIKPLRIDLSKSNLFLFELIRCAYLPTYMHTYIHTCIHTATGVWLWYSSGTFYPPAFVCARPGDRPLVSRVCTLHFWLNLFHDKLFLAYPVISGGITDPQTCVMFHFRVLFSLELALWYKTCQTIYILRKHLPWHLCVMVKCKKITK